MAPAARSRFLAMILGALAAGGCAVPPAPPPAAGAGAALAPTPIDFSLDLIVLPSTTAGAAERPPIARCVVFADATLHAQESGGLPARGADLLPPYRRTLSLAEFDSLWALCQELDESGTVPGMEPLPPLPAAGATTYTVVVTAGGGSRTWFEMVPDGERPAAPIAALLDRAAKLAWVDEADGGRSGPRRYDFGPDPYARYRRR